MYKLASTKFPHVRFHIFPRSFSGKELYVKTGEDGEALYPLAYLNHRKGFLAIYVREEIPESEIVALCREVEKSENCSPVSFVFQGSNLLIQSTYVGHWVGAKGCFCRTWRRLGYLVSHQNLICIEGTPLFQGAREWPKEWPEELRANIVTPYKEFGDGVFERRRCIGGWLGTLDFGTLKKWDLVSKMSVQGVEDGNEI